MSEKIVTKVVNLNGAWHISQDGPDGHKFLRMTSENLKRATAKIIDVQEVRAFAQALRKVKDLTKTEIMEVLNALLNHPEPEFTEVVVKSERRQRRRK